MAMRGSVEEQRQINRRAEWILLAAILTQLQWFFGNLYEEVLTPNSIVASIAEINAYNRFFRVVEPYYYYVPLTQMGMLSIVFLAFWKQTPNFMRALLRKAALAGLLAIALTSFIVIQYNLKMFFGNVDPLGAAVHQRYVEWALWNALRILLVGVEIYFSFRAYCLSLVAAPTRV